MKNTETPDEYRARRLDVQQRTGTQHGPSLQVVLASLGEGEEPLQPGALMPSPRAHNHGDKREQNAQGGPPLDEAMALLPTATAQDGANQGGPSQLRRRTTPLNGLAPQIDGLEPAGEQLTFSFETDWGPYEPAVRQWEQITRPAPAPHEPAPKPPHAPRLSTRFVEWMMGLPDGWVTDVPGVTDPQKKTALGNGVVPQQAAAAIQTLLMILGP